MLEKYLVKSEKGSVMVLDNYKMAVEVAEMLPGDTDIMIAIGNKDQHIALQALLFHFWGNIGMCYHASGKIYISFEDIDVDTFEDIIEALKFYGYKFKLDEDDSEGIIVSGM